MPGGLGLNFDKGGELSGSSLNFGRPAAVAPIAAPDLPAAQPGMSRGLEALLGGLGALSGGPNNALTAIM